MSDDKKELRNNVLDQLRSFFAPQDPQKKKDGLPPKTHFSIWYFLIAMLLITYVQQYFLSTKLRRFLTVSLNNSWSKAAWTN